MDWLNYNHLHYFIVIVQEGSLTKAAERLRLTHSTLSAQLKTLEESLGSPLFDRKGRRLILTPFGMTVADYASDIFRLGSELIETTKEHNSTRHPLFKVGVVGAIPKTIAYRILEPLYLRDPLISIHLRQDNFENLLQMLVTNRVTLVLSEQPAPQGLSRRIHSHLLGETSILLYATPRLAARYKKQFPMSLQEAPILFPGNGTSLRKAMERWMADREIRVRMTGEIEDAGHMRVFGAYGAGLFPVRSILSHEVEETHSVRCVGELDGIVEKYYAISLEQRVRSPLLSTVFDSGKNRFK